MNSVRHFVHQPRGDLSRFVREILWVRSDVARTQILLPETNLTLVLRKSGTASMNGEGLPAAIVSGLQPRARKVDHGPGSAVIVIRFTEVGAPAILHDRADLLYERTAALDSIIPKPGIERLQDSISAAGRIDLQIPVVERFLSERVRLRGGVSTQIRAAAAMIRNSGGKLAIAAIARRAAMSQSALERQLRAAVGTTPKMLSRLARLQHVCRLWDKGMSLTAIAFEAGYTDQPHMVRDFQSFTGLAPQEFFRANAPRNLPTFYK